MRANRCFWCEQEKAHRRQINRDHVYPKPIRGALPYPFPTPEKLFSLFPKKSKQIP